MFAWLVYFTPVSADIGLRMTYESGTVGQIVSVPIYVDTPLSALNITSFQLEISYNSSYLEALSPEFAGGLSEAWGAPTYNISDPGRVFISHAGVDPLEGTGIIGYLRFYMKRHGTININFVAGENTLFNEGDISLLFTNGRVTISPKPNFNFSPDGPMIVVGESVQYYVSQGTAPYNWSIVDNTIASISATGLVTGLYPGLTKVIAEDVTGIIDTADYFLEVVPFLMTIRDTSYYQNNDVVIPINISQLDAFDVMSGELSVTYNDQILSAQAVELGGSLLEGTAQVMSDVSKSGTVTVSFASNNAITGSGPLFFIRFKVADRTNGATQINISNALYNENLKAKVDNGYFSIVPLPPLNVTPKTGELLVGETMDFNVSGGTPPYQWEVSNESVASITEDGLLTALKGGDVVVKVSTNLGSVGFSNTIVVYDGSVEIATVIVPSNEISVSVPIYLESDFSISPIISLSGEMQFNENKINEISVDNMGSATQSWSFSHQSDISNFVFAGAGITGITGNTTLLSLDVTLGASLTVGEQIHLNWDDFFANEGSPRLKLIGGSIEITTPTAIDDSQEGKIRVWCDNNEHLLWIENIPKNCHSIELYDITGRMVKQVYPMDQRISIPTSKFHRGIYIVQLLLDKPQTIKVIL